MKKREIGDERTLFICRRLANSETQKCTERGKNEKHKGVKLGCQSFRHLRPASAARTEVVAAAVEVVPHGGGNDAAGAAVPVGMGLGTGLLGLPGDVTAGAPGRDVGGTGGLGHGNGGGESGDEKDNDFVEGHC